MRAHVREDRGPSRLEAYGRSMTAATAARPSPAAATWEALGWLDGDGPLALLCDRTHAPLVIEAIALTDTRALDGVWDHMTLAMHRNVHFRPARPETVPVSGAERRALARALRVLCERVPAAGPRVQELCTLVRSAQARAGCADG